jgi:hypothetical protein
MPLVVNSLKKDANGYSTEIEIRDGLLQTSSPEKPLFKARKL